MARPGPALDYPLLQRSAVAGDHVVQADRADGMAARRQRAGRAVHRPLVHARLRLPGYRRRPRTDPARRSASRRPRLRADPGGRHPKLVVVASSLSGGPTIQAVELHPLAQQFASVADAYERGRPEYAPAVIGAIAAELGIGPGDRVLDLAAGTGKLTRALVAYGFAVTAVEPLEPLRVLLSDKVTGAIVRAGLAEAIPLEDRSVAAVTIADAFHWFDRPRALGEIRRVLARGGGVALLNTVPDWGGASWAHELGTLVTGARPEHPNFDGRPWHEFVRETDGFADP